SKLAANEDYSVPEHTLLSCYLDRPRALARDCAQRNGMFGYPTRPCLYERGSRVTGRSVDCTPLPQAANLCECNYFDRDGDTSRRGARYGVHWPSARFDGVRGTCRRGLGACGVRDLGGWTTCDARMGARTDERVSDNARTRQHGSWRTFLGNGSSTRRPQCDFCCRGSNCPRGIGSRASIFNQLRR